MNTTTTQENQSVAAAAAFEAEDAFLLDDATATYSPEDNKLRLYPASRLDPEIYARVREAGFIWAPKQELFVASMWTPGREDLLLELCGEIGDESMSLADRQAARAARFADYSGKRKTEANSAYSAVGEVAKRFEFGQPILVGHHSERKARKDKERIEAGMRRAVNLWETSTYWQSRAAGSLLHAKHKELPGVRHRRIKGIEADKRKQEKAASEAAGYLKEWQKEGLTMQRALVIANFDHISKCYTLAEYPREAPASQYEGSRGLWSALQDGVINEVQAREIAVPAHERTIARAARWVAHYQNRIDFEKAMLGEAGGLAADKFDIQPGGQVLIRGEWVAVLRVTRRDGKVLSVTTSARYVPVRGIEEVKDYTPPAAGDVARVKSANKLPSLVNYKSESCTEMTKAEYSAIHSDYKGTTTTRATDTHAPYRFRQCIKNHRTVSVFLTDMKEMSRPLLPAPGATAEPVTFERRLALPDVVATPAAVQPVDAAETDKTQSTSAPGAAQFAELRNALKQGVQVVVAPQLFATSHILAARAVVLAKIERGSKVLEPSAGTGRILRAIREITGGGAVRTAVEINSRLCDVLRISEAGAEVYNRDFLQCGPELGSFDAVIMNPPFVDASDIKHILHALPMLKPGGRMVAICADGPRQNAQLRPLVEERGGTWEQLPKGTFSESGTEASTVLLSFTV